MKLTHVTQMLVGLKMLTRHTGSRGVNLEVNALKLTPMERSVKLLVTFKTTSIDKATGWACCMRKICLAEIQEILSTHTLCGAWGYCSFGKWYLPHYLWWRTLEERSNSIEFFWCQQLQWRDWWHICLRSHLLILLLLNICSCIWVRQFPEEGKKENANVRNW